MRKLYDKNYDFDFQIVNFPFHGGYILSISLAYRVYISQFLERLTTHQTTSIAMGVASGAEHVCGDRLIEYWCLTPEEQYFIYIQVVRMKWMIK